jgi:hypothetical protein
MGKKLCPACKKNMEGQVTMCPLCGAAYHKDCFAGSWDCVFCTTQISQGNKRGLKNDKGISPLTVGIIFVILMASILGLVLKFALPNKSELPHRISAEEINTQIDLFRIAIYQYENKNGLLGGTTLAPLQGKFLSSIPTDPWGNSYLYDGNVGIIACFGADGRAGGSDLNSDFVSYFRKRLHLIRAEYKKSSAELTLFFNKPCTLIDGNLFLQDLLISYGDNNFLPAPSNWSVNIESQSHGPEKDRIVLKINGEMSAELATALSKNEVYINLKPNKAIKGISPAPASDSNGETSSPANSSLYGKEAANILRPPMAVSQPSRGVIILSDGSL